MGLMEIAKHCAFLHEYAMYCQLEAPEIGDKYLTVEFTSRIGHEKRCDWPAREPNPRYPRRPDQYRPVVCQDRCSAFTLASSAPVGRESVRVDWGCAEMKNAEDMGEIKRLLLLLSSSILKPSNLSSQHHIYLLLLTIFF